MQEDEGRVRIVQAECLQFLASQADASVDLIYLDPPFNTGKTQTLQRVRARRATGPEGRPGFHGQSYRREAVSSASYPDAFPDYLDFLGPRLREAHRVLADDGTLILHLDPREVHYAKVFLDGLFGRASFLNEIIWAYDYGARSRRRWSAKHDVLLLYVKDPRAYHFDFAAMDRIPYMAPGLVSAEKAARGKTPTDVWWHTIVPTRGAERTGYPTQKPEGLLRRLVRVHSAPGDLLLDFFAGSGTLGAVAQQEGRRAILVDQSEEAVRVMAERLRTSPDR